MCIDLGDLGELLTPKSPKEEFAKIETLDPLGYKLLSTATRAEDLVLSKIWGDWLGSDTMADFHKNDADNPNEGIYHRGLAALAVLGAYYAAPALAGSGGTLGGSGATNAALAESAVGSAGYGASSATASGAGSGFVGGVAKSAAGTAVNAGVQTAVARANRPDQPVPLAMPDPQEQEKARRRMIAEMNKRSGRASTILTQPGSGTLGG